MVYDIIAPFTDTKSLNTLRDELLNRWGPLKMMEAQLWTAFRGTHGETGTFGETRNDWLISCIGTNLSPHPADVGRVIRRNGSVSPCH